MRRKLFLLAAACAAFLLFAAFSKADLEAVRVNETAVRLFVRDEQSTFRFKVENAVAETDARFKLDLLAPDDKIRFSTARDFRLETGENTVELNFVLPNELKNRLDEFLWLRARYEISSGENNLASGVVSLSEIAPDFFELRIAAAENLIENSRYQARVRAAHPFGGKPFANVKIEGKLELEFADDNDDNDDNDQLTLDARGETDADGFAILDFQIPAGRKIEEGELEIFGEYKNLTREESEDLDNDDDNARTELYLTVDKPLYQPGQALRARGLLLDKQKRAVADEELRFEIKSPDYDTVFKATAKTSRFGIASIEWQTPENLRLGEYEIRVEDGDDNRVGRQTVKISRYDLPNFAVAAKPDKTFYLPGQTTARVEISADYLFGKPVARGRARIVREIEREWDYKNQKWNIETAESYAGALDANGKFVADIDLTKLHADLSEDSWRQFKDFSFAAYATDETTNKTEQRRFDVRVSREPVHVRIVGFENSHSDLPIEFFVSTFYADGAPAACELRVFGGLTDSDADDAEIARAQNANQFATARTNRFGAAKIRLAAPATSADLDRLQLKIQAVDRAGNVGTATENVYLNDDDAVLRVATDKAIYRKGEPVKVEIVSSFDDALVYVDVVRNQTIVHSAAVKLKNKRASLAVPYNANFKNELLVAAYTETNDQNTVKDTLAIVYPHNRDLKIAIEPRQNVLRPGEIANVDLVVQKPDNKFEESALGVVVFDKAVEERARADAEFGAGSIYGDLYRLINGASFGELSLGDLNRLDSRKKCAPDLQLAAEILLRQSRQYYYPEFFGGDYKEWYMRAKFAETAAKQLEPVRRVLRNRFAETAEFPADEIKLREILRGANINFDGLKDAWGNNYRVKFAVEKQELIVQLWTRAADEKPNTRDDFEVFSQRFNYFAATGKTINRAVADFQTRSKIFVRDAATLRRALAEANINLDELRDRWNREYQINFGIERDNYTIAFHSAGANGEFDKSYADDFTVWTIETDYFAFVKEQIDDALQAATNAGKSFPRTEREAEKIIAEAGSKLADLRDGWNNPVYLTVQNFARYTDRIKIQNTAKYNEKTIQKQEITPVTQQVAGFKIRSAGADAKQNTADDFDLAEFTGVIAEQTRADQQPRVVTKEVANIGGSGAIHGIVKDPNGAVVPNATVTATEQISLREYEATSDEEGEFLIKNLASGSYQVKTYAPNFKTTTFTDVPVRAANLTELEVVLEVGEVANAVEVTVSADATNLTDASISTRQIQELPINGRRLTNFALLEPGAATDGKSKIRLDEQIATPRLREYFPETLLWQPEIITDRKGKAAINFRLADNITTWKMAVIGSTLTGEVGIAETEFRAFQPFFAELEPPKILTENDRIRLPVALRNYLDKPQNVGVAVKSENWFELLNEANQQIVVAPNESINAIVDFRAIASIKNGKQRVTAIANDAADAIEKTVSVHPDGREIVQTNGAIFSDSTAFDVNFPADALPKTSRAELKIYPNLLAHVVESIEGIVQRPYGCGEQTVSSTYPSLLILKLAAKGSDSALKTQAEKFLRIGYERLLSYQNADGGFGYWANAESDLALTAYALRFLRDAGKFVEVDAEVVRRANQYLQTRQRADGSFTKIYSYEKVEDRNRTAVLTAFVARVLAQTKDDENAESIKSLTRALNYLNSRAAEIDEPFLLANIALAAFDASENETGFKAVAKLQTLAKTEGTRKYWALETNTPFYGWGLAGRIETTALAVQALAKAAALDKNNPQSAIRDSQLTGGLQFLLREKDRYGVWHSTQATINVLDAIIAVAPASEKQNDLPANVDVFVNNAKVQTLPLPASNRIAAPILFDLTAFLNQPNNRVELRQTNGKIVSSANVVQTHYVAWKNTNANGFRASDSDGLSLKVDFDRTDAAIMQEITCRVQAERIGFRGYGMLLAEIGLPPGADVSRESLDLAMQTDSSLSRYDILPDRIVIYLWSKPGGTRIDFKFKPRYGIEANSAASQIYDYYNPESNAVLKPTKFLIR